MAIDSHSDDPVGEPAPSLTTRLQADELRGQAAACRRLAVTARTRAGTKALDALGDHFDDRARKLDPNSEAR